MKITKEKLLKLGFKYDSYIATGQYWENASKMWTYKKCLYEIKFTAFDVDKWHMSITTNMDYEEKYRKTTQITIIPLSTMQDVINAYKFITHIDLGVFKI